MLAVHVVDVLFFGLLLLMIIGVIIAKRHSPVVRDDHCLVDKRSLDLDHAELEPVKWTAKNLDADAAGRMK
jgi:hypothetical protein